MLDAFATKCCTAIAVKTNIEINSKSFHQIIYAFKCLACVIIKTSLLFIAAYFADLLTEMIIYAILLQFLRMFTRGIHFKSNLICSVVGFTYFFGGVWLARNLTYNPYAAVGIFIVCFGLNLLYAPAPTEKRLMKKKWKKVNKILALFTIAFYCGLSVLLKINMYQNLLVITTVLSTTLMIPGTKKLFNKGGLIE